VFGTRPDAVKMAPVVLELRRYPETFNVRVAVTGQHREQLEQILRTFEIVPDHDLGIMQHGQTLSHITTRALDGLDRVMLEEKPELVLAQGDTSTTFVAALAAFYHRAKFAHVEAGLRTDNPFDPFPEEMNRRLTAPLSAFHFAPTTAAEANLLREGADPTKVWVTGNTGIDALQIVAAREYDGNDPEISRLLQSPSRLILVTAHRRENLGEPMKRICHAIRHIVETTPDVEVAFALHKNPAVREIVQAELGKVGRIHLIEPPDYVPFVKLMQRSTLILTDSGGVQEEAPGLGIPVLVMRNTTERPEGIDAGVAKLVGTDTNVISGEALRLLNSEAERNTMARAVNPYGDGRAASQIRAILSEQLTT
jgi:UDP-N-acetylglucosamine 2-epimerase